ncbi:MAG: hypothetical protein IBX66_06640 [Lutibacter sp.]|nr:hypothetical protein [Lutibacter sp.]
MKNMKNTIYSLLSALVFAVLLGACDDFNDQFEGLDDKTQIKNLAAYNYTLTETDYTTISNAAAKVASTPEEISLANSIKTNKYFTTAVPASTYVPFLLKTQYPYADLGSTAMITYNFGQARPSYLEDFASASVYTLTNADYAASGNNASGFYPDVNPANFLPDILAANISDPTDGKIVLAKYSHYTEIPSVTTISNYLVEENFNYGTTDGNLTTVTSNWVKHSGTTPIGYVNSSLSMTDYPSSGTGGSATIGANSEDANSVFAEQTSGTVYMSALLNISAVSTGGGYFLHFMDEGTAYPTRVWAKDNGTGKILFGVGFSGLTNWGTTAFDYNNTYLLVASYNITTGVSNLYVLPSAVTTMPETPEVTAALAAPPVVSISKIAIRQGGGPTAVIDGVRVAKTWADLFINNVTTTVEGNKVNEEAYYKYAANKWTLAQNIYVLTIEDYDSMGTASGQPGRFNNFDSSMPPENYLPTLLAKLYPYAQNGNKQIVAYKYFSGGAQTRVDEYVFQNGVWSKPSSIVSKTEQFVFSNTGWVFDPTVKVVMGNADYQMMVDYVLATPSIAVLAHPFYKNEEYYYGFASRYNNVSFRLSYRNPYFTGNYVQPVTVDPEFNALTTDAAKVALMWTRLKEGMGIFLQLKYPNAVPTVGGLDVYYHATTYVYYPTGVSAGNEYHKYIFKCTAAASGSTPPTFEFVSEGIVN